jgi:hypothetical protein
MTKRLLIGGERDGEWVDFGELPVVYMPKRPNISFAPPPSPPPILKTDRYRMETISFPFEDGRIKIYVHDDLTARSAVERLLNAYSYHTESAEELALVQRNIARKRP